MNIIKRENLTNTIKPIALSIALLSAGASAPTLAADTLAEAFSGGKAFADLRLRYENADQDNNNGEDADALTLRTSFGYQTGEYKGFSVLVEAEDVREVLGVRDFSTPGGAPGVIGVRPGQFDIVADPETTELDQAFVQYKAGGFTGKFGRQVIALDGHRFVGTVGWRQDRQTYDGIKLNYKDDNLELTGAYVTQRNRIFAEEADFDSDDIFLNASYKFGDAGKLVVYSYLLDQEGVDGGNDVEIDTYGLSYTGSVKVGGGAFNYTAEYATQDNGDIDTDYFNLGAGIKFNEAIKFSLAFESLGSDNGAGSFETPLATLHKFNGWADVFLNTPAIGLEDFSATLDAKFWGGNFKVAYHDFSGDESDINGNDELGDEIDIQYTRNFGKHLYTGIKYSDFSQGSAETGLGLITDTQRFWVWAGVKFK